MADRLSSVIIYEFFLLLPFLLLHGSDLWMNTKMRDRMTWLGLYYRMHLISETWVDVGYIFGRLPNVMSPTICNRIQRTATLRLKEGKKPKDYMPLDVLA